MNRQRPSAPVGSRWLGSPVPRIASCLPAALVGRGKLRWGVTNLAVRGVRLETTPDHPSGTAVLETLSPVVVKHEGRYLLPEDRVHVPLMEHNIRHQADVLDLPNETTVEILSAGPRRRFEVSGTMRMGATVKLRVSADPALLDALYDWGLGLNTTQGFGWIRAGPDRPAEIG